MSEKQELPSPQRDPQLYEAVLEKGFKIFPERRENFLKYKSAKLGEVLDYNPVHLDIENVSRCNYRCSMCQVSLWPNGMRAKDLPLASFKALLDSQPCLVEVKIQGLGEPFLQGEDFFKMIKYARSQKSLWVRSSTNASILHLKDNYKRVLDSDICELQVSLDGASEESYQKIRRGGKLEQVKKNCVLLNEYGAQIGHKRTRMWVVLQRDNFHELYDFPHLASELGFERLTFSRDLNNWAQDYWTDTNKSLAVTERLETKDIEKLIQIGKDLGVEVTFWTGAGKYRCGNFKTLCPTIFQRMYVSSDLKLIPCANYADLSVLNFGEADHLNEVWNGLNMREFRKAHARGDIPEFCQACYVLYKNNSPKNTK